MKLSRLLILICLFSTLFHLNAKVRSVDSAKKLVADFCVRNSAMRMQNMSPRSLSLAYEGRNVKDQVDYYVFNCDSSDGFVIVCSDDRVQPILGYSDKGSFCYDDLPDNAKWWLTEYQRQLQYLRVHQDAESRNDIKLNSEVPALIQTKWGQGKGFNNQCPIIPTTTSTYYNGRACTGCVATGMAQIMKFHQWPSSGIGSHSYDCDVQYGTNANPLSYTTTLSAAFDGASYGWGDMVDAFCYYTSDYIVYVDGPGNNDWPASSTQINAVSKLMSDVGISIDMMYGSYERGGSAAYLYKAAEALKTYFGYDNSIEYIDRDYFDGDIESVLRDNLDARQPVLYSGKTADNGGHAFVIDGYDTNGYYHVNWGWNGISDGYFLLSLLSPQEQGAGSSEGGYNYRQLAVTNIKPTESGKISLITDITPVTNAISSSSVSATAEIQAAWGSYSGDIEMWVTDEWGGYGGSCRQTVCLGENEKTTLLFQCPFTGQEGKTYYVVLRNPYNAHEFVPWGQSVPFTVPEHAFLNSPFDKETIDFGTVNLGETCQKEIYVKGENLTSQLKVSISDGSDFTTHISALDAQSVNNGVQVSVTFAPTHSGNHTAQMTFSGENLNPVVVNLKGSADGGVSAVIVDSMLTSYWNQGVPYKNACPIGVDGTLTPPGCGAVALGQILNYHRITNHGYGHAVYDNLLADGAVQGTIDVNFDEHVYDWANILDDYSNNYTDEQSNAVADFLVQVGAGMKMMYRNSGSTPANDGSMLWGMHHHLHISKQCMKHYRRDYTTSEWREMLNHELKNGRPVMYGGGWYNPLYGSVVGHIFVIDGVNEKGQYHVNFGQTRNKNLTAYLELEVLNQSGTNPGGRPVCYTLNNYMLTDLMPVEDDEYIDDNLISIVVPVLNGSPLNRDTKISRDKSFKLSYTLSHYNYDSSFLEYALGFYQGDVLKATSFGSRNSTANPTNPITVGLGGGYRKAYDCYFRIPSTLNNGQYEMKFVCRPKDSDSEWYPVYEIAPSTMSVRIDGSRAHIVMPQNHQLATHLHLASPVQVVDTEFEQFMPGTTLRHEFVNPSEHNFQDTIRVDISIDGQVVYSHKYIAAVYEKCKTTYNILIPDALYNLKGKQFTTESYYYETLLSKYVKLPIKQTSLTGDVNGDGECDIADINIIINSMLGMSDAYKSSADIDKNGVIDIADINLVINDMLGRLK